MKLKQIVTIALGLFILTFTGTVVASIFIKPENTATTIPVEESTQDDSDSTEPLSIGSATDPTVQTFETEITVNPDGTTSSSGTSTGGGTSSSSGSSSGSSGSSSSPAPQCGNGGTCTLNQVATHNKQSDCWVIYSGKVYNVTAFVGIHEGGAGAFDSTTCGNDISAHLDGKATTSSVKRRHNHTQDAYNILSSYFIANLQ